MAIDPRKPRKFNPAKVKAYTVTMQSGLVDLLDHGELIMADCSFELQELVASKGTLVNLMCHSTWANESRCLNLMRNALIE